MDLLTFKVVIEPDYYFDSDAEAWQSYYPTWVELGAATGGDTQEEAATAIKEVLEMIVEEISDGMIEWPPPLYTPDGEHTKPSIQDLPELTIRNCDFDYPKRVAESGGLSQEIQSDTGNADIYRTIYVVIPESASVLRQYYGISGNSQPMLEGESSKADTKLPA